MRKIIILLFVLCACDKMQPHRGDLGEDCNKDGTCNAATLECNEYSSECRAHNTNPVSPSRCHYESECYCVTCSDKCGDAGVKACNYSDTSVWGAKPAVCECK